MVKVSSARVSGRAGGSEDLASPEEEDLLQHSTRKVNDPSFMEKLLVPIGGNGVMFSEKENMPVDECMRTSGRSRVKEVFCPMSRGL